MTARFEELLQEAAETDDPNAAARLTAQAVASREIEDAQVLAAALATVERGVSQVAPASLSPLAERLGRAYARTMARMRREQREAVRASVRRERSEP